MSTACGVRKPGRRFWRRSSPRPTTSGLVPSRPCSTSGSATWMRCSPSCAPREQTWHPRPRTWRVSAASAGSPILRAIGSSFGSPPDSGDGRQGVVLEGFQDHDVEVDGTRVHATVAGDGPPLLMLHGYPQTHVMWHRVAHALAE